MCISPLSEESLLRFCENDDDKAYSDDGERAFVELLEYVRVSAQLIFEDSAALRSTDAPASRH